jgi:hypothetical protein
MRKLLLIPLLLIGMVSMAQTKVSSYATFGGTLTGASADTLHELSTRSYTFELVNYQYELGLDVFILLDRTSGAVSVGQKTYYSNDGVNWPATAADSASLGNAIIDIPYAVTLTPAGGRYMKIVLLATSAVQLSSVYGYIRSYRKDKT